MNPVVGNIRKEWDWVKEALEPIEEHPVTSKKTFLCWIAWKKEGSKDVIEKHLDFFEREGKKYKCNRIGVKTAITGVEKLLLNTGWRCDMKNFSKKIKK